MKLNFKADVNLTAGSKKPQIHILAYNGGIMAVPEWGEIAIDLTNLQLPENIQILADHQNNTENLIGYGAAKIESDNLIIDGFLNGGEKAQGIIEMSKSGQVFQASVGVEPDDIYTLRAGEELQINSQTIKPEKDITIISKGILREVSVLPLAADNQTTVKIAAAAADSKNTIDNFLRIKQMKNIKAVFDEYAGLLDDSVKGELYEKAIEAAMDENQVRALIVEKLKLEKLRSDRPAMTGLNRSTGVISDSRKVLAAASLRLFGQSGLAEKTYDERALEESKKLGISCAMNLCQASLQLLGLPVPTDTNEMIRAAFSTSSLSNALADSSAKVLLAAFTGAYQNWRSCAKIMPVRNFHPHKGIRPILKNGIYDALGPTGELKHAVLDDEAYTFKARTRGRMFGITREDIINDDLDVVAQLMQTLGLNGARSIHKVFWETLRDSSGFFTSGNKNYSAGVITALGIDSLSTAIQKMRELQDSDKNPISLTPKTLSVPPAIEAISRQLLKSIELNRTADNAPTGNPWQDLQLQLAVEAYLGAEASSKGSDEAWYLFCDPNICPAVIVSFLNGVEVPTVETADADFNTLGLQFRAYLDFGVDMGDSRGAIKMKGEV